MESQEFSPDIEFEHVQFYAGYIEDTLLNRTASVDQSANFLNDLEKLLKSYDYECNFAGISLNGLKAQITEARTQLSQAIHEVAEELQQEVFQSGLFSRVVAIVGEEQYEIDNVMAGCDRVLPISGDTVIDAPINEVQLFVARTPMTL